MVQVNLWGVLLAAISSMVVGAVWYARPVFGTTWMKLVKLDNKKMQSGTARSLTIAFLLSLLMAYVLAHLAYIAHVFFHNSFLQDSVSTAFWVWLGIAFTRTVTHDSFEQRSGKLTVMNIGSMLVTMLVMGVIIGLVHP